MKADKSFIVWKVSRHCPQADGEALQGIVRCPCNLSDYKERKDYLYAHD